MEEKNRNKSKFSFTQKNFKSQNPEVKILSEYKPYDGVSAKHRVNDFQGNKSKKDE